MNRLVRTFGVIVAVAVVLCTTGCFKSENEGKLEGTKWSSTYVPDFRGISGRGMSASVQFSEGGRFSMEMRGPSSVMRFGGEWRTGPGKMVFLDNVTPPMGGMTAFTEYITLTGDVMIMEDPDGTKIVFTKIDQDMQKAARTPTTSSPPAAASGKATASTGGSPESTEKSGKNVKKSYGQ